MDVYYASGCTFLVVHYVSTTMDMAATPLVTVVSSGMSFLLLVTMPSSLMGLPATLG